MNLRRSFQTPTVAMRIGIWSCFHTSRLSVLFSVLVVFVSRGFGSLLRFIIKSFDFVNSIFLPPGTVQRPFSKLSLLLQGTKNIMEHTVVGRDGLRGDE